MSHKSSIERVITSKTVGVTEFEALNAAQGLRELSVDPESSLSVKAESTLLYRELTANAKNAGAREESMMRAASLAVRA